MKTMIMAVVLACLPAAAIAQSDTATPPAATETAPVAKPTKKKAEPRICREGVGANSRISTRRCKTEAEWAAIDARGTDGQAAGALGH